MIGVGSRVVRPARWSIGRGHGTARLHADLGQLGVPEGAIVLVHASLRKVAPVQGAPAAVADALLEVLGPTGTLAVPTQTTWNSTTSRAFKANTRGMSPEEIDAYKNSLPVFDPHTTPSYGMGRLAEYVRTLPGAVRSAHPHTSFAAVGPMAAELMRVHDLESHLGDRSPLGALREHNALVLMLGTEYSTSTIFHLAEYTYTAQPLRTYECRSSGDPDNPRAEPGGWKSFKDIDFVDNDFDRLGASFEAESGLVRLGLVGNARSRLYPARAAVDFAVDWLRKNRS